MDIEKAIEILKVWQAENEQRQLAVRIGSVDWHMRETIDDKIHELLTCLGD